MPVTFVHRGDLSRTQKFFERAKEIFKRGKFDEYGRRGVEALASATPRRTGKTADSWRYEIIWHGSEVKIEWSNSNVNEGRVIAVLIQYGHGTGTGGYVVGTDYINPAMAPVFDGIADSLWKEITSI